MVLGERKISSAEMSGLVGLEVRFSLMGPRIVKPDNSVQAESSLGLLRGNVGCVCSIGRSAQVAENRTAGEYFWSRI